MQWRRTRQRNGARVCLLFGNGPLKRRSGSIWRKLHIIGQSVNHYAKSGVDRGGFTLIVFLAFCVDCVLVATAHFAQKLRQDAQTGHVLIVGRETTVAPDFIMDVKTNAAPVSAQAPAGNAAPIREILPRSQREWTSDGQPAAWRAASPSLLKSDAK